MEWRNKTAQKEKDFLARSKAKLILNFTDIDIEIELNFIKPILILKLERNDNSKRIVNGKEINGSQSEYFQVEFETQNTGLSYWNPDCIKWQLMDKNNPVENYTLELNEFKNKDVISLYLQDSSINENQQTSKKTFSLEELISGAMGKDSYIQIDLSNQFLKTINNNQ